ncbi:MAG: DUF2207 family protein [Lentihominibacter sp.]
MCGNTRKAKRGEGLAVILAVLLAIAFGMPGAAYAEQYDAGGGSRVTEYFNVDIVVHENNSYDFTETVGTVFNTAGHGIFRYVPENWDGINEKVYDGWCSTDVLETGSESGSYVLQMGSEDSYISGRHEFKYGYSIAMRDDRDTSKDILYINLLPTNWETPIESAEITLHLPKPVDEDNITIYSGTPNAETLASNVSWEYDGNKTVSVRAYNLDTNEGITMLVDLPEGYWAGQYDPAGGKIGAIVMCIVMALLFMLLWFLFGRRQHVVDSVEFHPPEGMTPAEIGLIIDGTLDKKDMVSMFMYFAQRGYLKITERNKKAFLFTKLKNIDSREEKIFAQVLFDGIFAGNRESADSKNMGTEFGESYISACSILEDSIGDVMPAGSRIIQRLEGLWLYAAPVILFFMAESYTLRGSGAGIAAGIALLAAAFIAGKLRKSYKNRKSGKKSGKVVVRCIYWIVDGLLLLIAGIGLGDCFESGVCGMICIVGLGVCHVFNVYFDRMSDRVYETMGKVLGLRNFIKTAEVDRLNALVEDNPDYYFDILPYAYVLGLTNVWAQKFESIKINLPQWFEPDSTGAFIPAIYMGSAMNSMAGDLTSSVSHEISRSIGESLDTGGGFSGGPSGGGFSGGGSGGGGGGFW